MPNPGQVPTIAMETVLDWTFCEAKVWWQTIGRDIEEKAAELITPRTGTLLLQETIRAALQLGVQSRQRGNQFEFHTLLGTTWKVRLHKWGLGHMREKLAAYSVLFQELMGRFSEEGNIRKHDGSLYENPTWSYRWRDLAISMGLTDLRMEIDSEQQKAGLGKCQQNSKSEIWKEPIGLADAFARSTWIMKQNSFPIHEIDGIGENVYITLPHIRISVKPDLVIRSSDQLIYEKHLYGLRRPRIADLLSDYSIKALFNAQKIGSQDEVSSVFVRHMMTGRKIRLSPQRAAGLTAIAPMAAAVHRRINAMDFSGPRMVNGWDACGNCDYKPLCFNGEGLMERYNLPLSGQIAAADEVIGKIHQRIEKFSEEERRIGVEFARTLLPWVTQNPGMTAEQVNWLLAGMV